MKRINAFFQLNEGASKTEFLAACKVLVEESNKEAGCIAYDLFASTTRDDVFVMVETWKDDAAIESHNASEHFKTGIAAIGSLATAKVEVFEM